MKEQGIKTLIRCFIALMIITLMVGFSELLNEREIIFPEIAALAIGALIAPVQPWKVSKPKIVFLIAIHSFIGIAIVKFLPIDIIFKVIIGVAVSLLSIFLSKTTFAPLLSATVLPIILNTSSLVYPVSAVLLAIIIVITQAVFEKTGLLSKNIRLKENYKFKNEMFINLFRLVIVSALAVPSLLFDYRFAIAPPLIVAFAELTSAKNKLIKTPLKVWFLMSIFALLGSLSRVMFTEWFSLPLWVSALIAAILMMIIINVCKTYFPPFGAITILPMLIDSDSLIVYPFEVAVGFGIMVLIAFFIRNFTAEKPKRG